MRIVRFRVNDLPVYGVLEAGESRIVGVKGDPFFNQIQPSGQFYQLDEVHLLSPVIPRSKVVIVESVPDLEAENASAAALGQLRFEIKPNTAVIGPEDPAMVPEIAKSADLSAQVGLGVVFKTMIKQASVPQVEKLIAGYTVVNNFSFSHLQAWDTSCPLGPWIVSPDEFDPNHWQARLCSDQCSVAAEPGQLASSSNTSRDTDCQLTEPINPLLAAAWVSQVMTLLPGDLVVVPGSPQLPVQLNSSVISVIEGIGQLENRILPETR